MCFAKHEIHTTKEFGMETIQMKHLQTERFATIGTKRLILTEQN